jgi:magnesium chelatase subunit I
MTIPCNPFLVLLKIEAKGDETQYHGCIEANVFFEKLATPDVTVADLIGDVDPIKQQFKTFLRR